ncbi:hypothetical protein [Pendulispora albinea]|uniref:Uncharacterized protein n=1 Tax=Pendulispora albinea TaxID=2741071 RepID=A0ABZ2M6J7_9BACT
MMMIPAASYADTGAQKPCVFHEHRPVSVSPYRIEERVGRTSFRVLRGAEVYVQAEPGLTAEWLRLKMTRHLAEKHPSMPDCALDVASVRVEVESAGAGFKVRIIAPDTATGEEVLRRARLLVA